MGMFDPDEVIIEYSIKQAVEMGALVEVFKERWCELSGGKPIVASANMFEFESKGGTSRGLEQVCILAKTCIS